MSSLRCLTFTVLLYQLFSIKCHDFILPETFYNDTDLGPNETIVFRVINGKAATLGQFPHQVAFMMPVGGGRRRNTQQGRHHQRAARYSTFCGGTIIRMSAILTAAHCFETKMLSNCFQGEIKGKDIKNHYAVAGTLESGGTPKGRGQWRRLRRGRMPKSYKFPKDDIAIIVTTHPFKFNVHVSAMPVATRRLDYSGICVTSGYGRTSRMIAQVSPRLLYAELKVFSIQTCTKMHRTDMSKFICTSDAVSDVYKGDSGGPLVCKNTNDRADKGKGVLVGVTSGKALKVKSGGSFFTRVTSHAKFLSKSCIVVLPLYLLIMSLLFNILHVFYIR